MAESRYFTKKIFVMIYIDPMTDFIRAYKTMARHMTLVSVGSQITMSYLSFDDINHDNFTSVCSSDVPEAYLREFAKT